MAHLLKYDSIQGQLNADVQVTDKDLLSDRPRRHARAVRWSPAVGIDSRVPVGATRAGCLVAACGEPFGDRRSVEGRQLVALREILSVHAV